MDKTIMDAVEEAGEVEMEAGHVIPTASTKTEESQSQEDTQKDVKQESSAAKEGSSSTEDVKSEPEKRIPLDRFQEVIRKNRDYKQEVEQTKRENDELRKRLDRLEAQRVDPSKPELNQEQEEARKQLVSLLGLDGLQSTVTALKNENDRLTRAERDRAYDREERALLEKIEKFGLASDAEGADKVLADINAHIESHPILSKISKEPGVYELAFNSLYSGGQAIELGKRAASREEIKRQEAIKKGKVESANKTAEASSIKMTGNAVRDFVNLYERAGGEGAIDMNS